MSEVESFADLLDRRIGLPGATPVGDGQRPDRYALAQGLIRESELLELYAQAYGMKILDSLESLAPSEEFLAMVPLDYARQAGMIGLERTAGTMTLAVADPHAIEAMDAVAQATGLAVLPALAGGEAIQAALSAAYERRTALVDQVVEEWDTGEAIGELEGLDRQEDLLNLAHRAPVIKLVNTILFEAIRHRASDVHVQPTEQGVAVRFRVDGLLDDRMNLPIHLLAPMVSRIKIMGQMNVSERRLAQDGRCTARIGNRIVDLRISSVPCSLGERVVLRLLDKSSSIFTLEQLGMSPDTLEAYDATLRSSHGIILITGPTGSGKTTTLYASLQRLHSRERNILTLEDPVEYQLDGISQIQVNTRKGMTFASGLRHVLRQDPDVIMVGEIRDEETARMAVQSSLTGHLVFSTLHTNDAASAVARMLDLGVEPFLVASSLLGVLGQRLVRRLCGACREPYPLTPAERAELPGDPEVEYLYRERGCEECLSRGFSGRLGVFEYLTLDSRIRSLITQRAQAGEIRALAAQAGFHSMRSDGIRKVLDGVTTLSEVVRVTQQEEG